MTTTSKILGSIKSIGRFIIGISVIFGLLVLLTVLFKGGITLAEKILPLLLKVSNIITFFIVFILLPIACFKKTRKYSAIILYFLSNFYGFSLWIYSALVVYVFWGLIALFIGLFLMGIGVLPIAIIVAIFNGQWLILLSLIYLMALTYGSRVIGIKILERVEEEKYQNKSEKIINVEVVDEEGAENHRAYCPSCGKEISSFSNFCEFCGNKLN